MGLIYDRYIFNLVIFLFSCCFLHSRIIAKSYCKNISSTDCTIPTQLTNRSNNNRTTTLCYSLCLENSQILIVKFLMFYNYSIVHPQPYSHILNIIYLISICNQLIPASTIISWLSKRFN